MDGFPVSYFKTAPQNFDATVFDTDDLSTIRGASLTLLAMPPLLKAHLETEFPDVNFKWLQLSASELVFACTQEDVAPELTVEVQDPKPPRGKNKNRWNRALKAAAETAQQDLTDDSLRQAAAEFPARLGGDIDEEFIAGQIRALVDTGGTTRAGRIDDGTRKRILDRISTFLAEAHRDYPFDLMTCQTACWQPAKSDVRLHDVFAALDTQLSQSQYRSFSFPSPAPAGQMVCALTGVLPASREEVPGKPISENAGRRRKVGRKGKKGFYENVLAQGRTLAKDGEWDGNSAVEIARERLRAPRVRGFTSDFGEIVEDAPGELPKSLKGKICILNMDGNAFGALRLGQAGVTAYSRLSRYLDILKATLLADILNWADETSRMQLKGNVRLETLLWGGDEFTFVVPAWLGWQFAIQVQETVGGWKDLDGKPLSFSYGLVFGPHNAPIRDLKNAAEALTDMAKGDRQEAMLQALAYEGIDRIHMAPKTFRRDLFGDDLPQERFSLTAAQVAEFPREARRILSAVSRSALHNVYHEQSEMLGKKTVDTAPVVEDLKRIARGISEEEFDKTMETLFPVGDYPLLFFSQLVQLIDYIDPAEGEA